MRSLALSIILIAEACAAPAITRVPIAASAPTDRFHLSAEASPPSEYVWLTVDDAYAEAIERELERRDSAKKLIVADTGRQVAQLELEQYKSASSLWMARHGFAVGIGVGAVGSALIVALTVWAMSAITRAGH